AVTEAATNILKHGGRGEILLGVTQTAGLRFVDVLALDRGPGMANVDRCFEDGFSTAGSAGTGLGAVRRAQRGRGRRGPVWRRVGPREPPGGADRARGRRAGPWRRRVRGRPRVCS